MSTFRVNLVQGNQGVTTGGYVADPSVVAGVSKQRTMYAPGPHGTFRKLVDGEEFEDCNYWKRYAVPAVSADIAFIEVVDDDGSTYSDETGENSFPKVANFTVAGGDTYTDNAYDIVDTFGGPSYFTQITTDEDIKVQLNGDSDAILDVAAGTQTFDFGDVVITEIAFDNTASGATTATVQVVFSIRSVCNS